MLTVTEAPGAMVRSAGAGVMNRTSLSSLNSAFCTAETWSPGSATTSCQSLIGAALWLATVIWPVKSGPPLPTAVYVAVTGGAALGVVCMGWGATTCTGGVAGALTVRAGLVGRAGWEAGADIAGETGPVAAEDGIRSSVSGARWSAGPHQRRT